jgi:hypothetical protein
MRSGWQSPGAGLDEAPRLETLPLSLCADLAMPESRNWIILILRYFSFVRVDVGGSHEGKNTLRMFENRLLRRILGTKREDILGD